MLVGRKHRACFFVVCVLCCSVISGYLWPMDYSPQGSSIHGDSPGKNTGVGFHALLQGIFPSQGSNWTLLLCRQIFSHLSHQGGPRIMEWVAYPFSSVSSWWPMDQTRVSCIAGRFFTSWTAREGLSWWKERQNYIGRGACSNQTF